jgi:hypothetical protein
VKTLTPDDIAPHQVRVDRVQFITERTRDSGDRWRSYHAPDGEVIDVRVACPRAPGRPDWPDERARQYAVEQLNERRRGRAQRIGEDMPVAVQLAPAGGWPQPGSAGLCAAASCSWSASC